ncbi:centromere protein U isoform X1 [Pteronotus mesoamericanus]|uniref:centromere protein U isoform X1 n=1 Tax=Pteronotus mesoamericanus TaxID=1884717 RepID=UPI0023ED0787|nr:centromere protein U isoform X1 [Pteronotus parnellii mesoamericanus]
MASSWRVRTPRNVGARYSKNTVGRTRSTEAKAVHLHKPTEVYDFSDNSNVSSMGKLSENEKDEEPYESFAPPLHSTAIDADEGELPVRCSPRLCPAAGRSSNTSETEESEHEFIEISAKKKIQKKEKVFHGKRKKSRNEAINSDISDCAHVWCLKGKRSSDIMELDVVLSALEKTIPEYKQNIESKICREAINKFHSTLKEELMRTLIEAQKLKTLKRKNAKMTSDIEKKRQRLIEVQNELLWLEPQLKQLQMKYDELKERKSSLRNAAHFLSNLKQLHQDYSGVRESEPHVKETYDSSSLPALLFKGRTLLGAQSHLQNINYQLERLLERE